MDTPKGFMNHQKLISILRRILSSPTAPFHEYHVRRSIRDLLAGLPHVTTRSDSFGNLIATYQFGDKPARFCFGAHMDHPGFVLSPRNGTWDFLGGMPPGYLNLGAPLEEFGEFAMWRLPAFALEGNRVIGRACDDLVGCASMVCLFHELERLEAVTTCHAVFTRAEEVGFIGAIRLAQSWPFDPTVRFVSLETSLPMPGAKLGDGPVIRVGDGQSVFDHVVTGDLSLVARECGINHQRALLDRGSCEATATQFYGIPSAGISVLMGNYHNCGPDGGIEPEFVDLVDVKGMINLITQLVIRSGSESISQAALALRFEERIKNHAIYDRATAAHFR
ncbi:MAG: endoglucanase [Verrucomicrobia bacterium]|jgi:endoglucanase|nr:MAG: endoglucanase [Verrucomicrobiota bacterium]